MLFPREQGNRCAAISTIKQGLQFIPVNDSNLVEVLAKEIEGIVYKGCADDRLFCLQIRSLLHALADVDHKEHAFFTRYLLRGVHLRASQYLLAITFCADTCSIIFPDTQIAGEESAQETSVG